MRSGVIRIRVRCWRRWRMTSCPAANGMRWVNPSMATASPSRMVDSTAAASGRKRDMPTAVGALKVAINRDFLDVTLRLMTRLTWYMAWYLETKETKGDRYHYGRDSPAQPEADQHHRRRYAR